MRWEGSARANQMVLWVVIHRLKLEVLKHGGLHLVVTEVVPIGGGVDNNKSSCVVQYLTLSEVLRL